MSYLGLDIGTSGCKAAAFDHTGQLLATASQAYAIRSPQAGWAELDSVEVGNACLEVIRRTATQCGSDLVTALAISSQGEAFTVLDAEGRVLADAMVSSDSRATDLAANWPRTFGEARLYAKTGHTAHPIFSLFKLLWLRENRPDIWSRAARIHCFEDYLHHRLGVTPAISLSLAARTMLLNVREANWDAEILTAVGLRADQLARPVAPGTPVGMIPESLTQSLGLAPGAIVVAGGHDQVCAALGVGAIRPGMAALGSGTVECITVAFAARVFDLSLQQANLCTYSHAAPGVFATLAYHLTGGNLIRWFLDEFDQEPASPDAYTRLLETLPGEPTSLLALPYFTPSGTPYFDAQTPGAILGLRLTTRRNEILRALLEGVALEIGINLDLMQAAGIPVRELVATGGGAKNERWLQLKADVWNCRIHLPRITEAGCLGTALLACFAQTGRSLDSLLTEWIQIERTIEPHPQRVAIYEKRRASYRHLYAALQPLTPQLFPHETHPNP